MHTRTRIATVLVGVAATAAALAPVASAEPAVAITVASPQSLIKFDTTTPSASTLQPVTGLVGSEVLRGLDYRPATGQIFGYSSAGRLYTVDPGSGVATLRSRPGVTLPAAGADFNPVVDRLRLVSLNENNLRLNVDTGALITDSPLAYAPGDDNAGADPAVTASAYTNNFAGAGATVLYGIDSDRDILVTQAPPNSGTLNTIGPLGTQVQQGNGFDISGATGVAYAALTQGSSARLYRVDLGTGRATLVGPIGSSSVGGLAIVPAQVIASGS